MRLVMPVIEVLWGLIKVEALWGLGSVVYSFVLSRPVKLLPDDFRDLLLFKAEFSGGV